MSRTLSVRSLLFAAAAMVVGGILVSAQQEEKLTPAEVSSIRASVAKPAAVSFRVVTQDFTGSFASIRDFSERVKQEAISQKVAAAIAPKGATATFQPPQGILILQEDPTGKAQFRMAVGFTVPAAVSARPPLKAEQISLPRAVRHTHVGNFQELASVYHQMNDVRAMGFPVVLRLLDDPERVPLQFIRTELIVPVK
jgi:hypothetical protein